MNSNCPISFHCKSRLLPSQLPAALAVGQLKQTNLREAKIFAFKIQISLSLFKFPIKLMETNLQETKKSSGRRTIFIQKSSFVSSGSENVVRGLLNSPAVQVITIFILKL